MIENMIAEIIAFFLWLINFSINSTIRFKPVNQEVIWHVHEQGKKIILACWHGQFFPAVYYFGRKKICIMPITSLRGKILAGLGRKYGYQVVPYPEFGSPGERIQSVKNLMEIIKEGYGLALAVDGPPKPQHHKANPGVLYFSQKTGYPIIPISFYMKRKITLFWRWDKYEVPLPFSPIVIAFGKPLEIPADLEVTELEKKTKELEERLDEINRVAAKAASKSE